MQNYFTLYTLFIKGDTKFWLVVLDKYKKLQTRHKGLTLILKYKSALCVSLRYEYQIPKGFWFPFARKTDKFPVDEPLPISVSYLPSLTARHLHVQAKRGGPAPLGLLCGRTLDSRKPRPFC